MFISAHLLWHTLVIVESKQLFTKPTVSGAFTQEEAVQGFGVMRDVSVSDNHSPVAWMCFSSPETHLQSYSEPGSGRERELSLVNSESQNNWHSNKEINADIRSSSLATTMIYFLKIFDRVVVNSRYLRYVTWLLISFFNSNRTVW